MSKISQYLQETKVELKNVVWPKRQMVITHTIVVIVIAVAVGYLSGIFDSASKLGLSKLLGL